MLIRFGLSILDTNIPQRILCALQGTSSQGKMSGPQGMLLMVQVYQPDPPSIRLQASPCAQQVICRGDIWHQRHHVSNALPKLGT